MINLTVVYFEIKVFSSDQVSIQVSVFSSTPRKYHIFRFLQSSRKKFKINWPTTDNTLTVSFSRTCSVLPSFQIFIDASLTP